MERLNAVLWRISTHLAVYTFMLIAAIRSDQIGDGLILYIIAGLAVLAHLLLRHARLSATTHPIVCALRTALVISGALFVMLIISDW